MSISVGTAGLVSPASLWWSITLCSAACSIPSGSSFGLFVSTTATGAPSSSAPSSSGGASTPNVASTYSVSRLSSPSRNARAGTPRCSSSHV